MRVLSTLHGGIRCMCSCMCREVGARIAPPALAGYQPIMSQLSRSMQICLDQSNVTRSFRLPIPAKGCLGPGNDFVYESNLQRGANQMTRRAHVLGDHLLTGWPQVMGLNRFGQRHKRCIPVTLRTWNRSRRVLPPCLTLTQRAVNYRVDLRSSLIAQT